MLILFVTSFAFSVSYCPGSPQAPACVASVPYEVNAFFFVGSLTALPVLIVFAWVQNRRRRLNPSLAGYEPSVTVPDWGPMYVYWLADKLERIGYLVQRNAEIPGLPYKLAFFASRSRKGLFSRSLQYIGAVYLPNTVRREAEELSVRLADFCLASSRKGKSVVFAPGSLIVTLLVADGVDVGVKEWIRETKPRRHWGALESLILIPTDDRKIYYCRKTPVWGGALYSSFVSSVEKVLQMKG